MLTYLVLFSHLRNERTGFRAFIEHIFFGLHLVRHSAGCQRYHDDLDKVLAVKEDM